MIDSYELITVGGPRTNLDGSLECRSSRSVCFNCDKTRRNAAAQFGDQFNSINLYRSSSSSLLILVNHNRSPGFFVWRRVDIICSWMPISFGFLELSHGLLFGVFLLLCFDHHNSTKSLCPGPSPSILCGTLFHSMCKCNRKSLLFPPPPLVSCSAMFS